MPSNFERKARRKQQTRLTFDPVDRSSSPTNVSPGKALPTPTKSSQQPAKVDTSLDELGESEDELENNARQTRSSFIRSIDSSKKKKHRRLAMGLDGTYSSSDGSAPEDKAYTPSKKKAKRTPIKTPTKGKAVVINSDSEVESAMALPSRTNRSSAKKRKSITLSDSSEDEIVQSTTRSSQRRQSSLRNGKISRGSPASSSRMRSKRTTIIDESDSEEDDIRSSPPKRFARLAIPDDDEDEQDIRSPSPRKQRARAIIESEEDESQPIVSPLKRTRRPVESEDSDLVLSPAKRQRNSRQRDVDLSSDSDLPSPRTIAASLKRQPKSTSKTPPRFTRQQKTVRRHRTEKEKKMELLKRRRAGENIDTVTDSSESASDEEDDEDEGLQQLSEFEDEEPSPENARKPTKPAKRATRHPNSGGETDTDDFVIEDEEGPLGIPTHLAEIPLEFTSAAHKPIKEHFRDVVEWMVHNKVNPAFEWKDPVYETAFRKVDQECGGFADSKFVSTQWTAEFTKAIYARPILEIRELNPGEGIDVLGEAKCEACNHRKHVPTFSLQLKGKAYNKVTLEEVDKDSDSDEESDDDDSDDSSDASIDERGATLLSEDKQWFAGRVCKFNAEQAHTLIHWKWHLNDWVVSRLEDEGECTPAKLAERDKMKGKQRHKYANKIVDRWQAEGIIKTLYKDFKSQKDTARELQAQKRGGWK
ncbi:hypothetical protein F5882DRAFT_339084 [Hyaloscypha sp. PMI_1271]|nr:hypothetical protein F5882DRAFT_339084 [Hyaloscypha sp. PMI_1271]